MIIYIYMCVCVQRDIIYNSLCTASYRCNKYGDDGDGDDDDDDAVSITYIHDPMKASCFFFFANVWADFL